MVLSLAYNSYLKSVHLNKKQADDITYMVALQTSFVLNKLGYTSKLIKHPDEPSFKMVINDHYVARVVEGCNGVSMIILFSAFIAAFSSTFQRTLIYILSGSVLIYLVNVLRVVLLSIGLYQYPQYKDVFHSVLFPVIIYGFILALWSFWIKCFSKINTER